MAMPLAKLPACFNIPNLKNGYFSYLFNTPENYAYESTEWAGIHDMEYYDLDGVGPKNRSVFTKRHAGNGGEHSIQCGKHTYKADGHYAKNGYKL